jgi:hypothetical protein
LSSAIFIRVTYNGQELAAGWGLVMFINSSYVHFQVLLFVKSYTPTFTLQNEKKGLFFSKEKRK